MHESSGLVLALSSIPSSTTSSKVNDAIEAALVRLGYPKKSFVMLLTNEDANPIELRSSIEEVDPIVLISLDDDAGKKLKEAYSKAMVLVEGENIFNSKDSITGGEVLRSENGNKKTVFLNGRKTVFLEDFEKSLDNEQSKRKSWYLLKTLKFEGFEV